MSVVLGLDLGTTTVTALALAADSGDILARVTVPNGAETTLPEDKARGRSEWDAAAIAVTACACLRQAADRIGASWARLAGLGLTGQQHGCLLVDGERRPLTPLIGWQDRRGEEPFPGTDRSYTRQAASRFPDDYPGRTGCRLASGFLATTLFWLKARDQLPAPATACFLSAYFASLLTETAPVTDPTFAASAGVYDVRADAWADDLLAALGLPRALFPEVRPSGSPLGTVTAAMAEATGLPEGLPVFVGAGDNQASFLGSVADRDETELVNVGTGGQVSVFSERLAYDPLLETRPFPGGGYLLACVGLTGGRTYALLERFFRQAGADLFDVADGRALFERMNRLAASAPPGADGLRCEPFFMGTRHDPSLRGGWTGVSAENFTPAHLVRALLEGMARALKSGHEAVARLAGGVRPQLVGAGNGVRENPLLARLVEEEFGRLLQVPHHREEAAYGAALLAGVGAGIFPDVASAGGPIRYA